MKIYYAFLPKSYEYSFIQLEILGDFNFRKTQFNRFNFKYLFAVYYNRKVIYLFLNNVEDLLIFNSKEQVKKYADKKHGTICPLSIAIFDDTKEVNNLYMGE